MSTSKYQSDLIVMAQHVVFLWLWDPSPEELNQSKAVAAANYGANRGQSPQPQPIHHPSRQNTTYISMRPHITFRPLSVTNVPSIAHRLTPRADSVHDRSAFELASSEILVCTTPFISWRGGDGLQLTAVNEFQPKMHDVESDPLHQAIEEGSELISELSGGSSEASDVESKPPDATSLADVSDWLTHVNDSNCKGTIQQPLSLSPTTFKRGIIGSMSVNDILMIQGLIDPGLYIQFTDLSLFSHYDAA